MVIDLISLIYKLNILYENNSKKLLTIQLYLYLIKKLLEIKVIKQGF
jgi:hypothetical protein